jgi:ATP-dependent protease ClpP protease subunit
MRPLLNLLASNKAASRPLAMERDGDEITIEVVGTISSTDDEAYWWGGASAQQFARDLRAAKAGETVHIRVNSPGGDVFGGVAMAQAIRECKAHVVVHVDGYAASAASLLVAAAPESVIAPAGMVMIHKAWTIGVGNSDDFMSTAELLEKIDGELAATYQAKAGGDLDDWSAAMTAETWYTGAEAVAAGLVNRVADGAAAGKARAQFDLSAYARAPQPAAETETLTAVNDNAEAEAADLARRRRLAAAVAREPLAA